MFRRSVTTVGMLVLLTACAGGGQAPEPSGPGAPASPSATATKEPREDPTAEAKPSPAEQTPAAAAEGTISGQVCYPSDYIPEMTAYFREVETGDVLSLAIAENQATYEMALPPGTYLVFAYLLETPAIGGMYSEAVPCGLDASCTDHTPLAITVESGQTLQAIDICDWYDQDALPPDPGD